MQELIARLDDLYDQNPTQQEYRAGLAEAISEARRMLKLESEHIKTAWRDGQSGIKNQTGTDYYLETYGKQE